MDLSQWKENGKSNLDSLKVLEEKAGFKLPEKYSNFMLRTNGGSGFFGENYFHIWKLEDIFAWNDDYEVNVYFPDILIFGSNGAGEAFAFTKNLVPPKIVVVPFIGMSEKTAIFIGYDIDELLTANMDTIFDKAVYPFNQELKND